MILAISKTQAPVLYKLYKDGYDIKSYVRNRNHRRKLNGVIAKVDSIGQGLRSKPELLFFDSPGMGQLADKHSKKYKVWGASSMCDKLVKNPKLCIKKLMECGFKIGDEGQKITLGVRFENGRNINGNCAFVTTDTFYPGSLGQHLEGMSTFGWVNKDESLEKEVCKFYKYVDNHRYTGVIYFHFHKGRELRLSGISPFADQTYFTVHHALVGDILSDKEPTNEIAGSLRIVVSPYPLFGKYADFVYDSTKGLPVKISNGFIPNDLMFKDGWSTAGSDGIVGDIVATGDNIHGKIADIFSEIDCPGMMARVDYADYMEPLVSYKKKNIPHKGIPKIDYKELYLNAQQDGVGAVIKVTRLIRSEGLNLSQVLGG